MNLDQARDLIVGGQLLSSVLFDEYQQGWLEGGRNADEGEWFVHWLVDERQLTEFQAAAVLAGLRGPYMLGPYRVTSKITAGRMGDVYHAEHVEFQQPVSLKVFPASLSKDPELTARLGREARVSLQIDSPYVVKTLQVGRVGEIPFITLEPLHGETLQQRLECDGRIPYREACQLIQQVALGLAHIHAQEVVHRDISPSNLWLADPGGAKIMEFGASLDALSFVDSLTGEGDDLTLNDLSEETLGQYAYMSAQQAEDPHSADVASDLYSLGCTFYHCLTGQVPFPDNNPVRQMLRHANETPCALSEFDPEIPQAVQDVVSYLLAKQPEDRYGSAEEVASALAAIMPLESIPSTQAFAPDFLDWVLSFEESAVGIVDVPQDPSFQQFADWLSEGKQVQ